MASCPSQKKIQFLDSQLTKDEKFLPTTQCQLGPYFSSNFYLMCLDILYQTLMLSTAHFASFMASAFISELSGISINVSFKSDITNRQVANLLLIHKFKQTSSFYYKLMKKLQNPTTYFFDQADNLSDPYHHEIEKFVQKLIDKDNCPLCRQPYHIKKRIPRIMIHCGHTFCTPCLQQFFTNRRVRCPMCLKLVKYLDELDRLPINHTIFSHILSKHQKNQQQEEAEQKPITDAGKYLFGEFQRVQKEAHRLQNPQKYDPESGLPFCVFHKQRVQHFYCEQHQSFGCRVCVEIGHSKGDCKVVDLYSVDDPEKYHKISGPVEEPDISDPFIPYDKKEKFMLNLNDDSSESEYDESSERNRSI